jgi:hypothetical protein
LGSHELLVGTAECSMTSCTLFTAVR